jgi:hypothetical protein
MEKETLEEAGANYAKRSSSAVFQELHTEDFTAGANWQAKRMYSDDEVLGLLIKCIDILGESTLSEKDSDKKVVEFFNRYKKK